MCSGLQNDEVNITFRTGRYRLAVENREERSSLFRHT
jgi:hypothetical protein